MNQICSNAFKITVVVGVSLLLQAVAQPRSQAYPELINTSIPTDRAPQKVVEQDEFKKIALAQPIELPNLPIYSSANAKFIDGNMSPNLKGGPAVAMQFSVKGDSREIIRWYRQKLCKNNWCFMDGLTGSNGFIAVDNQNLIQVSAAGPSKPGSKCSLMILYKFNNEDKMLASRLPM